MSKPQTTGPTRRATMSRRAMLEGLASLPDGITYLAVPPYYQAGEFPHTPMVDGPEDSGCTAMLVIWIQGGSGGGAEWNPVCTRQKGHKELLHVAHIAAGFPVAAWYNDPSLPFHHTTLEN